MEPVGHHGDELEPHGLTWPERVLEGLTVVALGLLCLLIVAVVLARWLGMTLIPDDVLLVRELMVAIILLPLAGVTSSREHIEVSVFTERAPPRGKRLLALLAHLVGTVFAAALLWSNTHLLRQALATGEYYEGDLYIPVALGHAVFLFGVGVFLLRLIAMFVIDVRLLARR